MTAAFRLPLPDPPASLYRLYDTEGSLLYIGISLDAIRRMGQHKAEKPWWHEVARITLESLPNKSAARAAEWEAIGSESPRYNIQRPAPDPPEPRPDLPDGHLAFSLAQVVELTGVPRWKLYDHIHGRRLKVRKVGRRSLVLRQDLADFMAGTAMTAMTEPHPAREA